MKWNVCFGPSDLHWDIEAASEEDAINQAMGQFVLSYLKVENFHAMEASDPSEPRTYDPAFAVRKS